MSRSSNGATLGLVVATIFILVALGIAAFFIFQLLGGGRQTESAADAGALNVAKVAILAPTVQLDAKNPIDQSISAVLLQGKTDVNLLNFNKIVAWGLLVAANADADGSDKAKKMAKDVWTRIEGDQQNSIGAQLKAKLTSSQSQITGNNADVPSGSWPSVVFNSAALANATGFANPDAGQQISWQNFETGYLGPGDSTNVPSDQILNNLPFADPVKGTRYKLALPTTADNFIQGYVPIKVGDLSYYFVTVYHDQNPGLRTGDEFSKNTTQPGNETVSLPPNTFLNHAQILVKKTNSTLAVGSPATVGTKLYDPVKLYPGYIVLDNSPAGDPLLPAYSGPTPGSCDDVTCAELGQGIFVLSTGGSGQLFSTDQTAINAVKTWIDGGSKKGSEPSTDGIYNYSNGSQTTTADLGNIKGTTDKLLLCTDQNSDPINPNSDALCQNENSAWNNAYHPGAKGGGNATITGLTMAEIWKNNCFKQYNDSTGPQTLTADANQKSGLGLYADDANPIAVPAANVPWGTNGVYKKTNSSATCDQLGQQFCCAGADWVDTKRIGKITKLLTLPEILDQTSVSPPTFTAYSMDVTADGNTTTTKFANAPPAGQTPREAVYNYFKQRCIQMGAKQTDIDSVWNNGKLDVGEVFYVSLDDTGKLVATKQAPATLAMVGNPGSGLDGTIYRFYKTYNIFWNIVNAQNDYNFHDRAFTQVCTPGVLQATDSCFLEQGTGGLGGCLGRISFQQYADNGPGQPPTVVMTGVFDSYGAELSSLGTPNGATMTGAPAVCERD